MRIIWKGGTLLDTSRGTHGTAYYYNSIDHT